MTEPIEEPVGDPAEPDPVEPEGPPPWPDWMPPPEQVPRAEQVDAAIRTALATPDPRAATLAALEQPVEITGSTVAAVRVSATAAVERIRTAVLDALT